MPAPTFHNQPRRAAAGAAARRILTEQENFYSFEWLLLFATFAVIVLIYYLFTPYTHQLDEIKNVLLMSLPPFLLAFVVWKADLLRMSWRTHASTFLVGLFVLSMIISYLLNPYKMIAERVVWFQVGCATFTVIFAWFMDTESKMRKVMMFFVLLSFGSVAIGLFMFAGRGFTDAIYQAMLSSPGWRRNPEWITLFYTLKSSNEMYSTILNPDFYAAYLLMMLPLPLSMFFVEEHIAFKILAVITFLLMNVCLFFTNSNDSFMAITFLTYPLYFFLGFRYVKTWNLTWKFLATFFICSAVLALTLFLLMLPKLSMTWDFKAAALEGRKVLWLGGFWPWLYRNDFTMNHLDWIAIIFGTGPGGYRFYFPVFRRWDFFDNQINNVTTFGHNWYLDVLLEYGAVGLLIFLCFYARVLYDGIQQIRHTANRSHQFYQMAAVTGLVSIALQNFFSPNNRWAVCGMIYWSLFGLSMGLHHLDTPGLDNAAVRASSPRRRQFANFIRYALYALTALFIVRSVPQGIYYWPAARANSDGLRAMEAAENYKEKEKEMLLERARASFVEAIRLNPTFVTSYYKLAHVYNTLRDTNKAIAHYRVLDAINPHYSEIHLNLGIMSWARSADMTGTERQKELETSFNEIREAARQSVKPNVQWTAGAIGQELASLYATEGKKDESLKVYEKVKPFYTALIEYQPLLDEQKNDKKHYYQRAEKELVRLASLTNDNPLAEKMLKQMYFENPDQSEYLDVLLNFYDRQGKTKEKVEFLKTVSENAPLEVRLRNMLAAAYLEQGGMEKHIAELRRAEILEPKNMTTLSGLYLAYQSASDANKTREYKDKLAAVGVNADSLTSASVNSKATSMPAEMLKSIGVEDPIIETSPTPAPAETSSTTQ
ncbi:MAG: hypothetical protein WCK47_08815 [bacterium]|nr:O-antigen ligase family protein [Candidatus Sumerlaeota bacterium]